MALQLSTAIQNARLDQIEAISGASAILKFRSGPPPAHCSTADAGTVLATLSLPADWMAAAVLGAKAKSGTWEDPVADANGTIGHFRIYDSGGATCHVQGTVTVTGSGGDLTVETTNVVAGQDVVVTAFTITDGNE